jgi:signal transduction histidine kinase
MRADTRRLRQQRVFWGAAAAASLIIACCTANSLRWLDQPFPGFFVWEDLFVAAVGGTDWTGYEAGIPFQTRVVSMDGEPLRSARDLYARAARLPEGTAARYVFAPLSGNPVSVSVATMRLSGAEYLWTLGNYLVVGAFLTVLGFVVFYLRPDAAAARALLAASTIWGLYLVTSADIFGPSWFRPLCLLLQAMGPASLVHLALTFPVERGPLRRHRRLLPGLYGVTAVIGLVHNVLFYRAFSAVVAIDRLNSVALVCSGGLLLALLAESWMRPPSAAARQRTKIAAAGSVIAFITPVAGFFVFYLLGVTFPLNFVTFSILLFPLAIGYAIVRHDLFEVDAIIRRTVAWAILTALIAAVYLTGIGAIDVLFTARTSRIAQLAFLLGIVAVFNPMRGQVQRAVDVVFARERYDYGDTVRHASQALARLLDADHIVAEILAIITGVMRVELAAIWLRDATGVYRLRGRAGGPGALVLPAELSASATVVQRLELAPEAVLTDEDVGDDASLARAFPAANGMIVVPIAFEGRPRGFIALGRKESGQFYSAEDRGVLQTLASQGAVALENAASYRRLEQINAALRSAQAQLIQSERFAAIGEVSAAVAHGIRNPVAGIKAAARVAGLQLGPAHAALATIGDIVAESDKLEARIKALLDFAKPFEPHPTACPLADLVDQAAGALHSQMQGHGVTLVAAVDGIVASVDRAQLVEVLLVLMSNAIEAMPNGGTLRIAATREDDARIRIEVSDTGSGMSAAQQARLFHLFATTKPTGTGIGLAVARKIIERHRGTIAARSTPGEGTCFTLVLPAA